MSQHYDWFSVVVKHWEELVEEYLKLYPEKGPEESWNQSQTDDFIDWGLRKVEEWFGDSGPEHDD